jgi:ATP-dependent DNA helicase RecQ
VLSDRWGEGTVQRYDGDQITVLFDEHGYRELYLPVVREHGLLQPADGTPGEPASDVPRQRGQLGALCDPNRTRRRV